MLLFTLYITGHRILHESKYLYQSIHKLHHQWVDTYAVAATAAHPIEHVLSNLMTVVGTALVIGLPFGLTCIFINIALISTCTQHSGYGLIFKINYGYFWHQFLSCFNLNSNKKVSNEVEPNINHFIGSFDFHHDFHHHFQSTEYGTFGICDKIFGTRMKDQFPKAWKKVVKNCIDNGYLCNGITNDDLIQMMKTQTGKAQ